MRPFLVYRDRIGARSEISFLRRQYVGFTRLRPVWTGRVVLPDAADLGAEMLHLGGAGPLGAARRLAFRHFGAVPALGVAGLAPVVHAQFARGGALALPLARKLGARLVVTLHGGDIAKAKNWRGGSLLAQRWGALVEEASRFVCVSDAVAHMAAVRGVPREKLLVLPIGVELPAAMPAGAVRSGTLFVGRFVEKKGLSVLAEAMRRVRAAGDTQTLVCVGDGPDRPILEALARELPGITLAGWKAPAAVQQDMEAAQCLVVPSIVASGGDAEGLPSVIPEAMASGCAVIGSGQGGIAEAIRNEQTGLLVTPGDPAALAASMLRLAREDGLRDRLAAAAFADVALRMNARVQSAKLEDLLLGLIKT